MQRRSSQDEAKDCNRNSRQLNETFDAKAASNGGEDEDDEEGEWEYEDEDDSGDDIDAGQRDVIIIDDSDRESDEEE